jgi:hypothetical protein
MGRSKLWEADDVSFLEKNYPNKGLKWCCIELDRSNASIRQKASNLGLKQDREGDFFKEWQDRAGKSKIGKKRPEHSIVMKEHVKNGRIPAMEKRTDEQNKKLSLQKIKWFSENEHPRGMLGKKHTKDNVKKIGERAKKMWADPNSIVNSEKHRQYLSDNASTHMNMRMKNNPSSIYSRCKKGTITIVDKTFFARSRWEANIGAYLQFLKEKNEIKDWEHEPKTFWFLEIKRGVRSYLPDFFITNNDDSTYYIEVKGYMDAKSKTKLKRMAKYYPDVKVDVIEEKRYNAIKRNSSLYKHWGLLK